MVRRGYALLVGVLLLAVLVVPLAGPAPAGAEGEGLVWWAVGDSYSSGEGMSGTDAGDRPECVRATGRNGGPKAWAVVAHETLAEANISSFAFTPCTGAVSSDVPAQLDEAAERSGSEKADIVTLSMGGNDIYFADVMAGCTDLSLSWDLVDLTPGCDIGEAALRRRVDMLAGKADPVDGEYRGLQLPKLYDTIAERVRPGGTVIVLGYPHLVEETARWDFWRRKALGDCEAVKSYDVGMLRSVTGYLNQQIASAVQAANEKWAPKGVRFEWRDVATGVYESSDAPADRHGLCSKEPWINGVTLGWTSGDAQHERSFHPHQAGHTATGTWLASWMRATLDFSPRPEDPCPSDALMDAVAAYVGSADGLEATGKTCEGGWALFDACDPAEGCVGDSTFLAKQAGGAWEVVTSFPSSMCRSEVVALGAPAGVVDRVEWSCEQPAPSPPPTPSGAFTCSDLEADRTALIDRFEAAMGPMDIYADHPQFFELAEPAVAELLSACGAPWATEIANEITGKTYRAVDSIIQQLGAGGGEPCPDVCIDDDGDGEYDQYEG